MFDLCTSQVLENGLEVNVWKDNKVETGLHPIKAIQTYKLVFILKLRMSWRLLWSGWKYDQTWILKKREKPSTSAQILYV